MATLEKHKDDFFNSYLKSSRFRYAMGVGIVVLLNLLITLIMLSISGYFNVNSILLNYLGSTITTILAIVFGLMIYDRLMGKSGNFLMLHASDKIEKHYIKKMTQQRKIISILFLKKFHFRKFFVQIRDALILTCLIYVPLDFISSLFPGVIQYQFDSLSKANMAGYLIDNSFVSMILITVILHFMVAFREEAIYRGFHITLGEWELNPSTTLLYSSILFGLAHFNYIFQDVPNAFFPIWWGFNGLFIGTASAYYFLQKHSIWPVILAHWFNNIISSIVTRHFIIGVPYLNTFTLIYLPTLIVGFGLLVIYAEGILKHLKNFGTLIKGYFSQFYEIGENSENSRKVWNKKKAAQYLLTDLGLIVIIWLLMFVM